MLLLYSAAATMPTARIKFERRNIMAKKSTKKVNDVNDLTEEEINARIEDCFTGMDTEEQEAIAAELTEETDDFKDMFDRYNKGDKVRDICKDYEITVESFYKGIKKYQDKASGIEPAPVEEPKAKAAPKSKKPAAPKTAPVEKAEVVKPAPVAKKEDKPAAPVAAPKETKTSATPKTAPARTTDDLSGVTCWREGSDGREYIANFIKAKGKKADNEDIKVTTNKKEAKVWRTMYAAVDFLCKREKDTTGWNISHQ